MKPAASRQMIEQIADCLVAITLVELTRPERRIYSILKKAGLLDVNEHKEICRAIPLPPKGRRSHKKTP